MPLNQEQINDLAEAIDVNWNLERLILFTNLLEYNLQNKVPSGSVKTRALKFISDMNSEQPPPRSPDVEEASQFKGRNFTK